jgi:uncharacterized protein (DUF1778 family)
MSNKRLRANPIPIRFTAEEKALIEKAAQLQALDTSSFARSVLIQKAHKVIEQKSAKQAK